MATPEDYCGIWRFTGCDHTEAEKAYPVDKTVTIGVDDRGEFLLAWADVHQIVHVLTGLTLDQPSGHLIRMGVPDLATGQYWDITIQHSSTWDKRAIQAAVKAAASHSRVGEDNLTGTWGADAHTSPPPVPPATFAAP